MTEISEELIQKIHNAAFDYVFDKNGHKWSNNDNTAGDNFGSFSDGAKWMQAQSQWISLKDKYPEDKPFEMYRLLGWSESRESGIVCLYQDKCFYNVHKNNNFDGNPEEITDEITHWMPLPESPTKAV